MPGGPGRSLRGRCSPSPRGAPRTAPQSPPLPPRTSPSRPSYPIALSAMSATSVMSAASAASTTFRPHRPFRLHRPGPIGCIVRRSVCNDNAARRRKRGGGGGSRARSACTLNRCEVDRQACGAGEHACLGQAWGEACMRVWLVVIGARGTWRRVVVAGGRVPVECARDAKSRLRSSRFKEWVSALYTCRRIKNDCPPSRQICNLHSSHLPRIVHHMYPIDQ